MAWLKGVRNDGFINVDKNVNFRGTVLGTGDGAIRPYGALDWYVDGTDGSDANSGKSWEGAFATVQKALTTQVNNGNGKGDRVWIAPGTYSEAVQVDTLNDCEIIGATSGGISKAVIIHNSAGHALEIGADSVSYTNSMLNSALRNITFYTAASSNQELAAVRIDAIQMSVIDNCRFLGNYQASAGAITTVGLQLGFTGATDYSFHEQSVISNNVFGTSGARAKEVDTAIRVGDDVVTTPASTGFATMDIVGNMIIAQHYGIRMQTGESSCGGSRIAYNTFHSHQGGGGVNIGIYSHAVTGDLLMMIHDNRGNVHGNFAAGFPTKNLIGNLISVGDANAVGLYPPAS